MLRELGSIVQGDKSILDHDFTHATSGLFLYPAFDTGFTDGAPVVAPERVTITRHSGGSYSGWSFYATGASGIWYYVTHLRLARASVGRTVEQGGRLGTVGNFVGGRVPHAHVGINVERLLGAGVQLRHNTNYTHGQPTLREQLRALIEEESMLSKLEVQRLKDLALRRQRTGEGPGPLSEEEAFVFWACAQAYEAGENDKVCPPPTDCSEFQARLSQIHALSAP